MRGIKNILQSYALPHKHQDYSEINVLIEKLDGNLAREDKLAALNRLYDLISQDTAAKSNFSSLGFPSLCRLLREDADNAAIVRAGLECIAAAVCARDGMLEQEVRAIGVNAEQFARTKGAVDLLFWLQKATASLGSDGTYIIHLSLDILHSLFLANTVLIQESILATPNSMSQLVSLLDRQEILRDNALLVLLGLVRENVNAQNSAVHNGCFDKLFAILRLENYMYGSAVVINVFRLLINLIAANEPNQQLFLKSGYADALVVEMKKCLDPLIASGPPKPLSAEMADVMGIALEVVMACNSKQFTEKIIPMVRKLILSRSPKSQLRVVLWRILTHSMLMNLNVGFDEKDIQYLMTLAFQGSYSYPSQIERHNAINFVAVALEMTGNGSFDSFEAINTSISELKLLERQHPFTLDRMVVSSRFAAALSTLLVDNQALKIKLLEGLPSMAGSQNLVQLFTEQLALSILQYGNTTEAEELAANFCSVLLAWLPNSADAVARFLDQLLKAPFLVGALLSADKFGSGTVVIQGVCSVLLGICCIHAPSEAAVKPTVLIDAISNQIGWERYLEQLSQFIKKSEAHSVNQVPIWPDMVCAKLRSVLVITHNDMRQLSPFAVEDLKEEQEVSRPLSSIVGSESSNKLPECELYEKEAEASEWKTELLNAKMENKRLLEELNAVKATEERLRTSLEKAEADLEGLSKAYTALDSYAEELRVKLDALESRNHDYSPKVSSSLSTSKDDESAMEDLLVCLALEEAKVAQLERELALLKGTNV